MALDGAELATSDLVTDDASPTVPSALTLDDLLVGEQPLRLRVEAGDRPGQVGQGDVRPVAVSEVVMPGTGSDPLATTSTWATTTTHAATTTTGGATSTAPGEVLETYV